MSASIKQFRFVFPLFLLGFPGFAHAEAVHLTGSTMGTHYSVKYVTDARTASSKKIQRGIDQVLEKVNDQMSTYLPDSEISRFNASRKIDTPFPVSADTMAVVEEAVRLHRLTEGGLDITLAPLVNLWGFGPEQAAGQVRHAPSVADIEKRRAWVGMDKLLVTRRGLVKKIPELTLDLSAIAKGYGVDRVAAYLDSQRIADYMVDIGGEIRVRGKNAQRQPWRIAIEKPSSALGGHDIQEVLALSDEAIATSGNYRNYFEENGKRYSHTIDPRTGRPVSNRLLSISVLDASCMTADGLATGFDAIGAERALALANALNIPVMMILDTDAGPETVYSEAFKARREAISTTPTR